MQDFLKGLNDVQRSAVENFNGAALVIAGAGSGKTRVLTYRIAYLLSKGVSAGSVLSLTFTNKAAKEMKERISALVGPEQARFLWMGTFHSLFSRILRAESEALGYPSTFTIYDTQDSKSLIKQIVKEMNLDEKVYKPGDVLSRISNAKNNLVTPQAYAGNTSLISRDNETKKPHIVEIYKRYAIRCKQAGAMDFDDLLLNTNILFRDHPQILAKYQERFKYILVDEYQDTNYSQYLIVKKLAQNHGNVCVVGDDAQSIYSFRGAKIENILNFKNDYPGFRMHKLEQNYRSTKNIVKAANSIIDKNRGQIKKDVWSDNEEGDKIKVIKAATDIQEGYLVTNSIQYSRMNDHYPYGSYAILYRTNSQSRIFEEALRKCNIPYRIYGGISFYQRKEIKDILSYFRVISNSKDSEALKRIINYPARGIGKTTLDKIETFSTAKGISMWEVVSNAANYPLELNKGTLSKLSGFVELMKGFQGQLHSVDAYDLAYQVATKAEILKDLHNDKSPEGVSKHENLQELLNSIKDQIDTKREETGETIYLDKYIEEIALLTDADNDKDEEADKVTLMTIHSSKGLEFKNVYIVGIEEELFPSRLSMNSPQELEEERRLFYVAVTRAEKQATLSFALNRYKWGTPTPCTPSRFIKEIDPKYIELPEDMEAKEATFFEQDYGFSSFSRQTQTTKQADTFSNTGFQSQAKRKLVKLSTTANRIAPNAPKGDFKADDPSKLKVGMQVEHERFGMGEITNMEGNEPNIKATVLFHTAGEKQLLLKFAKLRIVG